MASRDGDRAIDDGHVSGDMRNPTLQEGGRGCGAATDKVGDVRKFD